MGIFDIDHKNKCPLCGKSMDYIYGDMVCSECGYRASYGASSTNSHATSSATAPSGQTTPPTPNKPAAPKITYTYTSSNTASTSSNSDKKSSSKTPAVLLLIGVVFVAVCAVAVFAFISVRIITTTSNNNNASTESSSSPDGHDFPAVPESDDKESTSESIELDVDEISKGIAEVIELIFDKNISEITSEELASIGYLDFHYYDDCYKAVGYGLVTEDDVITGRVFPNDISFYNVDFSIFPNLDTLYMEYGSIGSLEGLDKLRVLGTDITPSEIAAYIDPSQLETLTLMDLFLASDLSGIEDFTNLTALSLEADYLDTIDPLANLTNLKTLRIYDGYDISSFKALYNMPQLESLYLDCESLRDIGFVSNMPALKTLVIWNSEVQKIDALKDCSDSLTCLDLSYNYEITDYEVVSQLTKLEDLSLYVSYSFDDPVMIPNLGNMPNLTTLLLGNIDDLSELANAPGLQSLTLYDTYSYDFSALAALQNLTSLELYDMSLEPSVFEPVMELTNLEYIALDGSYIWGNVEGLLKLPKLKEFYMADCTAGFDVTNLEPNETLEVLDISNTQLRVLLDGKWDYNNDTNILALSENTDIFKNYQNLRELYLTRQNLDSVQFAASLPYLEILDITDNYVTDLTPLAILPNLEYVMCDNNPIVTDGGLGSKVSQE